MFRNIISNQPDLLTAIAKGGQLYQSRDEKNGQHQWWLREKNYHVRVLLSTGDATERKGHIEPTGLLYWRLTDAGKQEIDVYTYRTTHCTCGHERRAHSNRSGRNRCLAKPPCTCTGFQPQEDH